MDSQTDSGHSNKCRGTAGRDAARAELDAELGAELAQQLTQLTMELGQLRSSVTAAANFDEWYVPKAQQRYTAG